MIGVYFCRRMEYNMTIEKRARLRHSGLSCSKRMCELGVALAALAMHRRDNPKGVKEKSMASIKEYVLQMVAERPTLDNDSIAEMCRKQFPGANTTAASVSSIKSNARRSGELERVEVTVMGDDLLIEDELPETSGESDEEVGARIAKRFNAMDRMARAVMSGIVPAMIGAGPAGLGKSYSIKQALDERKRQAKEARLDFKFDYITGAVSPVGLYISAWNHKEEGNVIVLDDCDSIFADEDSLNLLKAMLDSNDRRELSWRKKSKWLEDMGIDDNFEFKGSVIFLTNLDFEKKADSGKAYAVHFKALMDRCLYLHLTIRSVQDFLVRIRQVVYGEKMLEKYGFSDEQVDELMQFVYDNRRRFYHLSLRLIHHIALLQMADGDNWKDDVEMTKMRADSEALAEKIETIVEGADVQKTLEGVGAA